jgi:hypothetical protein
MIEWELSEQNAASRHWSVLKDACQDCCGPWFSSVRRKTREAATDTSPSISLTGDEPPISCAMVIFLGGCEIGDTTCLDGFEDALAAREAELATAESDLDNATASLSTLEGILTSAISAEGTAEDEMLAERLNISGEQQTLNNLKIRVETYTRRNDTVAAGAAEAAVVAQEELISEHEYWDDLSAYESAVGDTLLARLDVFATVRVVDERTRERDIAEFHVDCATHNVGVSTSTDQEMWTLELQPLGGYLLEDGDVIALRSSTLQKEGWYSHAYDLTGRDVNIEGKPLPQDTIYLKFQWREVYIPDDGSAYVYGTAMEETVAVASNTLLAQTALYHIDPPTTGDNGVVRVASPALRAEVVVQSEIHGASGVKYGFLAYQQGTVEAKIYRTETASGKSYTGHQEVDEFGSLTDSFSDNVPENCISTVWPTSTMQAIPQPVEESETVRRWGGGLILTLSEHYTTPELKSPVDSFMGESWGSSPPADPLFTGPHHVLFPGEARYSRAKQRTKFTVTIPEVRPFDVEVTVKWNEVVIDSATGAVTIIEESRAVTIPTGELEKTEDDWTEHTASEGTIVTLKDFLAEEHADVWVGGARITVVPAP